MEAWFQLHFRYNKDNLAEMKSSSVRILQSVLEEELYPTGDGLNLLETVLFKNKFCLKDRLQENFV